MSTARDVIAELGPIYATQSPKMWAHRLIDNLTASGYTIISEADRAAPQPGAKEAREVER